MRPSSYQSMERRRTVLRLVFFFIIMATLPFYLLGFYLVGDTSSSQNDITPAVETLETLTPIRDTPTNTILPTWTPRSTSTTSPLGPTPFQYVPPPTLTPTQVFIPPPTIAPTLTLFPSNTPLPTGLPTTVVPTTIPTTAVPPTAVPTTEVPPTAVPTTEAPPTAVPTTEVPPPASPTPLPPPSDTPTSTG